MKEWKSKKEGSAYKFSSRNDRVRSAEVSFKPMNRIHTKKYDDLLDLFGSTKKPTMSRIFSMKISTGRKRENLYYGEYIKVVLEINEELDEETKEKLFDALGWKRVTKESYADETKTFRFDLKRYEIFAEIKFSIRSFYKKDSEPRAKVKFHKGEKEKLLTFQFNTKWLEELSNDGYAPVLLIRGKSKNLSFTEREKKQEFSVKYTISDILVRCSRISCDISYDPDGFAFQIIDSENNSLLDMAYMDYPLTLWWGWFKYIFSFNSIFKIVRLIPILWGIVQITTLVLGAMGLPLFIEYYIYGIMFLIGGTEFGYTAYKKHLEKKKKEKMFTPK